jgi:hypothetical protein
LNSPHQNCLNSVSRYATKNYPKIKNLFYGQEQFIFKAFALAQLQMTRVENKVAFGQRLSN